MAAKLTPEEEQKLLNELLKKQIELQTEGYSLSTSYLESLKEVYGIKTKQTVAESNLYSLSKQINKEILNQKFVSSDINEISKQIKKNQDLINKTLIEETNLKNNLSKEDQKRIEKATKNINGLHEATKKLEKELAKEKSLQDTDLINRLNLQIHHREKNLNLQAQAMSQDARGLLYTQKQREELEKQHTARKEELKTLNSMGKVISDGLKDTKLSKMKDQIKEFLQNPMSFVKFLVIEITKTFLDLDKGIGDFAKGMNMSYQDAAKLNNEFNSIANSSMDVAVTTKGIRETMMAMGQAMGTNAILNAKDAVTMTKLREQAGFSNDELAKMEELTLATGGNLEDNTKNLLGAANITAMNNGVLLNEKEIMKDIAKTSAATKLSLGGSGEALGKAAAQAKALGMSLDQVDKIADSLLQIESSISNELEAELLTGKNLNLEGARLAALNNDMEGLSKEIAKNYGTAAEFSKMNRLQQEAAAKAVGMTREELAGTLVRAEALKSMSGEQAEKAKEAFDARVKEVGLEQAQKEIKEGQLQKMMQQQSIQERFNQSIEKLKEIFVSLLAPLMPILDIFAMILKPVGIIAGFLGKIINFLSPGIALFTTWKLLTSGIAKNMLSIFSAQGRINIAKKLGFITDQQAIAAQKASNLLAKDQFNTENQKELVKKRSLGTAISENIQKRLGLTLDKESLLGKIKSSAIAAKDFVLEKGSLAFKYTRNALETGYNAIKKIGSAIAKSELILNIGKAAMGAISSLSSIPIVGWALGLAAAGTIAALGYKYMKGNDVMSPGYGKRTLMGPEGAIALNDKDTVIAGTNLFDKKADDAMSEPGKITEFKPEGAISAPSSGGQIDYNALASAVVSALKNSPMTVNSTLMLDKDVLAKQTVQAVSDNATKVGTAAAVGTSKI